VQRELCGKICDTPFGSLIAYPDVLRALTSIIKSELGLRIVRRYLHWLTDFINLICDVTSRFCSSLVTDG